MILVLDNYDSFTYNLVQLIAGLGPKVAVARNDAITPPGVLNGGYQAVVISPGPGTPDKAGISMDLILQGAGRLPILGVCLGHQAIAAAFGGKIVRSPNLMHGKVSRIFHDGKTIFAGLPSPLQAVRYHSLEVDRVELPRCLEISAWTAGGEIMGLRHKEALVEGIQFHPESMLTEYGTEMLRNFLQLAGIGRGKSERRRAEC